MLELLTGSGLALGALDRFTTLVELPSAWARLANEWVLLILVVLPGPRDHRAAIVVSLVVAVLRRRRERRRRADAASACPA